MSLPILRLDCIDDPDAALRLRHACTTVGFFYLSHHGVPPALERRIEQLSDAFFALPTAEKEAISMARGGRAWRGWFPLGGELTSGRPDQKEGLYLGDDLALDDLRVLAGWPMHGANVFPAQPRGFREAVADYMREQERVGQQVLRGIAVSLGLEPDHFARHLTGRPTSLFRIFRYPPHDATGGEADGWGVGEHTDYGLLTLLKQDDVGGLEVKTPEGWTAAPPLEGTYVCNLGDMLDRLTGGLYRSTPHRVRNVSGRQRTSWPFFLDPAFDAEIAPLPGAAVRPAERDAAERWDRASVHTLRGTYGDYLLSKVSRVFPDLAAELPG